LKISIIIPTINRYEDLQNTVNDLFNQSLQDFEILIIDQTDTINESVVSELKSKTNINYILSTNKSASAARNIGLLKSKYEIVLFLDDDVIIENKDFLKAYVTYFEDDSINGVIGPIIDVNNQSTTNTRHKRSFNKDWGWLFFPRNYDQKCEMNVGGSGNLCVRRSLAISIGGMDENFVKGAHREEGDFCYRYTEKFGWFIYDPKCALIHIGRKTGGVRSWSKNIKTKAQHHFDGSFYFIFNNVKVKHYPIHLFATLHFFFYRKEIIKRPDLIIITFFKLIKGIINGLIMLKNGPKHIHV
jgi:glycosyltransferase involved in cell wall biosynthesis